MMSSCPDDEVTLPLCVLVGLGSWAGHMTPPPRQHGGHYATLLLRDS